MITVLLVVVLTAVTIGAFTAVPAEPKEPKPINTPPHCICILDCKIGYHCGPKPHCTDPISCRYCTCLPNDPCDKKAG